MKITDLPYYPNFVFMSENSDACFSTKDIEMFEFIKYEQSQSKVDSLEVGDKIYFEPNNEMIYEIISVSIRQIVEDTDFFNYGFDSQNCTEIQGKQKSSMLKIMIKMNLLK